jgi:hypothetical protein
MSVDDDSDPYDFDEQLNFGTDWEAAAKKHLRELFTSISVSNISYDEEPELQRAGIDVLFQKENTKIDIKTQRHEHAHSPNLPIEVMSVMEDHEPGWFYTADSDLVVWIYPNKAETNVYKTGYLMTLTDGLREWFNERSDEFDFTRIPNRGRYGEYDTGCRLVPIKEIPDEYLVEFDPRLPTDRETPQSDIMRWAD